MAQKLMGHSEFENLVNQECRETSSLQAMLLSTFENLVNQECRETTEIIRMH